jgi:hypothetical protein
VSQIDEIIDPVRGSAHSPRGADGRLVTSQLANAALITPDDLTVYDPPIQLWIGDSVSHLVTVVPYGRRGDRLVQYPTKAGMTLPVMVKQVMATGTTATILIGQQIYVAGAVSSGPTADSTTTTADNAVLTADSF